MINAADRLRQARISAGYESARTASDAFGWPYPTYSAHENGSRGINATAATRYARAFQTTEAWLLYGTGPDKAAPRLAPSPPAPDYGFAENAVIPFVANTASTGKALERVAQTLAPNAARLFLYRLQRPYLDFGMLPGDVILADLGAKPKAGQLVIANSANDQTGAAQTGIFRCINDTLIPSIEEAPEWSANQNRSIMATVAGSLRLDDQG